MVSRGKLEGIHTKILCKKRTRLNKEKNEMSEVNWPNTTKCKDREVECGAVHGSGHVLNLGNKKFLSSFSQNFLVG